MSELRGPIVRRREGKLSPRIVAALVGDLTQHFGNKISTSEAVRIQHGHTLTWTPNAPPDAVLYAESRDDVIDAVKICAKHDAPIVPFGAGSSLEGHLNALHGGLSIDLTHMDRVIAVHAEDLDCVAQMIEHVAVARREARADLEYTRFNSAMACAAARGSRAGSRCRRRRACRRGLGGRVRGSAPACRRRTTPPGHRTGVLAAGGGSAAKVRYGICLRRTKPPDVLT